MTLDRTITAVLVAFAALLTWGAYSAGADNLSVLLCIGGGIVGCLCAYGNNEDAALLCLLAWFVGLLFAFFGTGFLAALALFFGGIFAFWGMVGVVDR